MILSMVSMSRATPRMREELALQRDDDAVRGGQGVDGEQTERGLAVDEDDVVVVDDGAQHPGEDLLAGHLADELDLGGRQVDVGRHEVEVRGAGRAG